MSGFPITLSIGYYITILIPFEHIFWFNVWSDWTVFIKDVIRGWICSLCKNVNEFNVLIIVSPTIDEDKTPEIQVYI